MSKNTIYNLAAFVFIDITLRNAIIEVGKEFEREHGRKNSAGRIYVHVSPEQKAARVKSYKSGEKQDAKFCAIAYVENDGTLDYKNSELLEALTTVLGNKEKLTLKSVAYSKGFLLVSGATPTGTAPISGRVIGRETPAAPPAKVAEKVENPTPTEKSKRAPKKSAKNAEISHEDDADDEIHA